jgi:hypothetical protein
MRQKVTFRCTAKAREADENPPHETKSAAVCPACDLSDMIKKQKLKDSQGRSKENG